MSKHAFPKRVAMIPLFNSTNRLQLPKFLQGRVLLEGNHCVSPMNRKSSEETLQGCDSTLIVREIGRSLEEDDVKMTKEHTLFPKLFPTFSSF